MPRKRSQKIIKIGGRTYKVKSQKEGCLWCGKEFRTYAQLQKHFKAKHKKDFPHMEYAFKNKELYF